MDITAVETSDTYIFTVTDGTNSHQYQWCKEPPEGLSTTEYLQTCKKEALLLTELEIIKKQPPTPVNL